MAFNNLGSDANELAENHDINVTPFIDVMLVLLIIFMVAAPLATVSIPVDLPNSSAKPQPTPEKPLFLTIEKDSTLTLGDDNQVKLEQLTSQLDVMLENKEQRIYIRADQNIAYKDLMAVVNQLNQSGYLQIALVGLEGVEGGQ
ncbi:MAG: TonB system transport protein ExbD [Parashewanella sp.]